MSPPLTVSLLDLITTGEFGGLEPGMTRQALLDLLGKPDDFGGMGSRSMMQAGVWLYGFMEFHFYDDDTLWMLYTDHIGQRDSGASLSVDAWLLGPETTLAEVLGALLPWRLPLTISHTADLVQLILPETSVKMTFESDRPSLAARFSSIQRS